MKIVKLKKPPNKFGQLNSVGIFETQPAFHFDFNNPDGKRPSFGLKPCCLRLKANFQQKNILKYIVKCLLFCSILLHPLLYC